MTTIPTADEMVERVRAALWEMGWEGVNDIAGRRDDGWPLVLVRRSIPEAVAWSAYVAAGFPMPCWACWTDPDAEDEGDARRCSLDGDCSHPEGPAVPPRELLVRGPGATT